VICAIALLTFTMVSLAQPCHDTWTTSTQHPSDRVLFHADDERSTTGDGGHVFCLEIPATLSAAPNDRGAAATLLQNPPLADATAAPQVFPDNQLAPQSTLVATTSRRRLLPLYLQTSRLLI
jgi:hypothetical protein